MPDPNFPPLTLQPHQQALTDQAMAASASGEPFRRLLYWQVGSGKSLGALSAADALGGTPAAVAPAALRPTLRGEAARIGRPDIPVVSYQQAAAGKAPNSDTLLFDEAQRLGSSSSSQAQTVAAQAQAAKNVILMSGTPIRNRPSEFAPLMSILTGQHITPEEFDARYVGTESRRPGGVLGWLRRTPPVEQPVLKNTDELKALLAGKIDYYENQTPPPGAPASVNYEDVESEMTPHQAELYRGFWDDLPFILKYKLKHRYDLSPNELARFQSFIVGPRQVALSDYPFRLDGDPLKAFRASGKLTTAFNRVKTLLADPRAKAIAYSNYPEAGLRPYAAALADAKIPHAVFHGGLSDAERKQLVEDFNAGRTRVALVGPAGAEGISLKGAQRLQLLDNHWNQARMTQAQARGIRFDSHAGLPEDLRNVTVERHIAKLPLGLKDRLLAALGRDREGQRATVDDYLRDLSAKKQRPNDQLLALLREVAAQNRTAKVAADRVCVADAIRMAKLAALVPTEKTADATTLAKLREAKARSDAYDYAGKLSILRDLMTARPQEWAVDSDQGYTVGVVHNPTRFRLHAPRHAIADLIPRFARAPSDPPRWPSPTTPPGPPSSGVSPAPSSSFSPWILQSPAGR